MFTRTVEVTPKSGKARELANIINENMLPILKKQKGFVDETVLVSETEDNRVLSLSFWNSKEDAERYQHEHYSGRIVGHAETIPARLPRTGSANHLQREHTKVGGFTFASFVLLLRFFAGLFLTLRQQVAPHNNFVAKVCVQLDFRTLQPVNSSVLFREPDFLWLIAFN
jgi:heme-degrading monooxygenase HmoA